MHAHILPSDAQGMLVVVSRCFSSLLVGCCGALRSGGDCTADGDCCSSFVCDGVFGFVGVVDGAVVEGDDVVDILFCCDVFVRLFLFIFCTAVSFSILLMMLSSILTSLSLFRV